MTDEKAFDNYECEGQMSISDFYPQEPESTLIAVSKIFARAMKTMSLSEWKAFVAALTQIKWTAQNKAVVYLDKSALAKLVGVKSDPDHLSVDLKRSIGELPKHSFIEISDPDRDYYDSGVLITRVTMLKNRVKIKFEEDYLPLFQELNKAQEGYITMWAGDLFMMASERAILLYEDMRLHSDTRKTNSKIYTTKELKEMFGIPKDGKGSYMRPKNRGGFDRKSFETYVLLPVSKEISKCRMINLVLEPDGSYWEKVKQHGYVVGYRFTWTVSEHPRVASAEEVSKLQARVDKNPKLLKVAKDIVEGEKKPKRKSKVPYNDFPQRDIEKEYPDLEKRLQDLN